MRKIILLLIVGFAVSFVGCNKLGTDPSTSTKSQFILITDVGALQKRITFVNEPLDFVTSANKSTAAITYTLIDVWNLASPVIGTAPNTVTLSASSIATAGTDVYVGFHVRGSSYSGEILKIAQNDTYAPDVTFGLSSDLVDVNDLEFNVADDALYIAGESELRGTEALKLSLATSGVTAIGLPIFGASGNSVTRISTATGEYLWVSAGGSNNSNMQGGLMELDLASVTPNDPATIISQDNAKHFDHDGDNGIWIYGNNGTVTSARIFNNLTSTSETTRRAYVNLEITDAGVTDYGKNAVDVEGTDAFVAMGAAGAYRIQLTGTPGVTSKYNDLTKSGLANGIASDGTYVYVAHGEDGLIVLDITLGTVIGQWNATTLTGTTAIDNGSCNFVAVGDITVETDTPQAGETTTTTELFVAFGRGGLMKLDFIAVDIP